MSNGWFSGCHFKSGLDEQQVQDAFTVYLKNKKCKKSDFKIEIGCGYEPGTIQIEGDESPHDNYVADGEILAGFISGVISDGEFASFHSVSEGERCDAWLVISGKYYEVKQEGTVYGADVDDFGKTLVGDPELKRKFPNYRHGIVEVALNEVIYSTCDGFLDLLSEKLIGSTSLMQIEHVVIGFKKGNILLIKVEGFEDVA